MHPRLLLLAVLLLSPTALATQERGAEAEPGRAERVDAVFGDYTSNTPGCSVGVIEDGELAHARGYGMANLEHGIALSPESVFRIGSTSKQFVAGTVILLAAEGKLSLEDDIRDHLPELPDYGRPITMADLIHHTSGLRDYLTLMELAGYRDDDWASDEDALALIARQRELNFEPGSEHLYSNSGYFLLSQIVKRAAGETLREAAERLVFQPLGMDDTHFHDDPKEVVVERASGYAPTEEGGFELSMTTLPMVGDGGVFTTVEDLLKWDRNFYDPTVGGPSFVELMQTRGQLSSGESLDYASGLVHGSYRGLPTVRHGGAFVGFRAEMVRFPEQRVTIACLCNRADARPERLANAVADVWLEEKLGPAEEPQQRRRPEDAETTATPSRPLSAYTGTFYSEELDAEWRIALEEGQLRLEVGNRLDGSLTPVAPDTFRVGEPRRDAIRLEFGDAGERRDAFRVQAGRVKNVVFERLP